jgi:hypothetical protein
VKKAAKLALAALEDKIAKGAVVLRQPSRAENELTAKWHALEGDMWWLANALRRGTASNDLQALAADLLEGKVKPRRNRKPWRLHREDRFYVAQFVAALETMHSDKPRKWVVSTAASRCGVHERSVYNALDEFGGVAGVRELQRVRRGDRPDQSDQDDDAWMRGVVDDADRDSLERLTLSFWKRARIFEDRWRRAQKTRKKSDA